ncbi:Chitinase 5 [Nymphaea thermarum]|nr:Chitinase 5 [Nymphaea thermarum]
MKSYTQFLGFVLVALVLEVGLAQDTPRTIVTSDFFNTLLPQDGCEGKGFYNYDSFISAAESFNGFGTTGGTDVQKRELAAFLANVMHETGSFCYINEQNPPSIYCDPSNQQYPCASGKSFCKISETDDRSDHCNQNYPDYPCAPGKSYYGRGPNFNYGAAGQAIGFDGLNNPEIVAQDKDISFKTAVWFWMLNSNCHRGITTDGGFGSTIRGINSLECDGKAPDKVQARVSFYQQFCQQFGLLSWKWAWPKTLQGQSSLLISSIASFLKMVVREKASITMIPSYLPQKVSTALAPPAAPTFKRGRWLLFLLMSCMRQEASAT